MAHIPHLKTFIDSQLFHIFTMHKKKVFYDELLQKDHHSKVKNIRSSFFENNSHRRLLCEIQVVSIVIVKVVHLFCSLSVLIQIFRVLPTKTLTEHCGYFIFLALSLFDIDLLWVKSWQNSLNTLPFSFPLIVTLLWVNL